VRKFDEALFIGESPLKWLICGTLSAAYPFVLLFIVVMYPFNF